MEEPEQMYMTRPGTIEIQLVWWQLAMEKMLPDILPEEEMYRRHLLFNLPSIPKSSALSEPNQKWIDQEPGKGVQPPPLGQEKQPWGSEWNGKQTTNMVLL